MRCPVTLDDLHRPGRKPGIAGVRPAQKSSTGNGLGGQRSGPRERLAPSPRRLEVELVCQAETPGFDPYWDGPRLTPTFVAQLMGQVMPKGVRHAPASAYEPEPTARAILCDTKL
jgi:hypothetical protein